MPKKELGSMKLELALNELEGSARKELKNFSVYLTPESPDDSSCNLTFTKSKSGAIARAF